MSHPKSRRVNRIGLLIFLVAAIAVSTFLQFHSIEMTASAIGLTGLVAALEGNLLSPWLTGRAAELNTVAVFVSVLFWGWMWGGIGLLLAVPIAAGFKAVCDNIRSLRPYGAWMGD